MRYQVLFYFLKPYKFLYGGILVATLCASVLESLSLAAFFPLFSSLLGNSGREQGGILGSITSMVGLMPFSDPTVAAAALLMGIFLLKTGINLLREGMIAYASGKVLYDAKNRIMATYAKAHYQFFLDSKQGTLIYNNLIATQKLAILLLRVPQMVADLFKILAIIIILAFISPLATLALAVLGLGYFGVIHHLAKNISYHLGKGRADAYIEQTVILNEFISGIRQITIFRTAARWLERFRGENRTFSNLYTKDLVWLGIPKNLMQLTAIVLMLGLILVLSFSSPDTFTTALPKLGVFAMALIQLLPSLTALGGGRMEMLGSMPDAELVYHAMTEPILRRQDGDKTLASFEQAITFENVSFAYKDREPLLKGVNLTFEKGRVTALVGPSGAGKTTIINLILELFEPSEGRITIDGVSLQNYKSETWLNKIGFVSQEPFVYHATIADNIAFSRNGRSEESIMQAARIANAHDFISEFPQGYDTVVGDRGMKLSGGQQQRIAIARAVLNEPEILIFDEATSSLDSISEKLVQEAIDNVSSDRTVIIIAHRLSTIRYADKIIVLDEGRVIEEGTHQELLERQGHYFRLVVSSS